MRTNTNHLDPAMPCLVLLTHLYCHYLLLTPDDEFFAQNNTTNPLSLDEVLELGAIWRDLAFWGYMLGVSPSSEYARVGDEDSRALLTKGVTRLAARKYVFHLNPGIQLTSPVLEENSPRTNIGSCPLRWIYKDSSRLQCESCVLTMVA
jgi:hypothetical protein